MTTFGKPRIQKNTTGYFKKFFDASTSRTHDMIISYVTQTGQHPESCTQKNIIKYVETFPMHLHHASRNGHYINNVIKHTTTSPKPRLIYDISWTTIELFPYMHMCRVLIPQ